MNTQFAPAATAFLALLFTAGTLPAQTIDAATQPTGVSKVRIVRLSEMKGTVQVDRGTGSGYEPAMTNLPIVEGSWLYTQQGVAEVEFEDNSTLRLAPATIVKFDRLERLATGATVSSMSVLKGTVYASLEKTRGNEFDLVFGQRKLALAPATHVRLQIADPEAKLAVLEGTVNVDGASGSMEVGRKKTVTFALENQTEPTVAKNIEPEAYDSWDQNSAQYHARVATLTGFTGSPYSYGLNDMSYYGSFTDAGGCGSMWRPYFASAAWDPFSNGAMAWYPGSGYSWVSPYPWGWTPYHSGSWSYCPNMGWGWQPGGGWYGLSNMTAAGPINVTTRVGTLPRPPRAPRRGEATITAVNLKPLVASQMTSADSFEFRRDSAGLGIPRDTLGKLDKLSRQTVEHGMARTPVYMTVAPEAIEHGRMTTAGMATTSIHRGSAPAFAGSGSSASRGGYSGGGMQSSAAPTSMSTMSASASHASAGGGGSSHGH